MNFGMRFLVVSCVLLLVTQVAAGCEGWNTGEFFESALLEEVAACLEAGAEVNAWNGTTPLHNAALLSSNPAIITALADAGANLEARSENGWTPLHLAVIFNPNPNITTALLDAGPNLEARDEHGRTPLYAAAIANVNPNPAIITALLDAGADATARNNAGKTPWDYAKDNESLKGTDAYWRLNEGRFE